MIISLIVAMDETGGIGQQNRLPWHLPSDLKRFKELTMGHHLVMGRKTYETIGKPLAGRKMVVITHQKGYLAPGCLVVHSLEEALKLSEKHGENEVFIIGGGEIFQQAIDLADKIYLTTVHAQVGADVIFPKFDPGQWNRIDSKTEPGNGHDDYATDFTVLLRIVKNGERHCSSGHDW